jgi:GntR family transcriptional regulator, transcriptional repressor for pyruvate dehydrogenase complex
MVRPLLLETLGLHSRHVKGLKEARWVTEIEGRRAFEVVVGWIEDRILAGQLRVGDSLPPERELAARLGVGRSAVREAVRTLQAQGVLRPSVGAGATGGTRVTAMPSGALSRLLRMHVALANFPLADVLEVRVALERLSGRLAAGRLDQRAAAALEAALGRMRAAADREEFNDADSAFHVAIAEAAGNRLAADTTVAIRESVREPLRQAFAALDPVAYRRLVAELTQEHEAIRAALVAGDGALAEQLLEAHVRSAWTRLHRLSAPGTMGA